MSESSTTQAPTHGRVVVVDGANLAHDAKPSAPSIARLVVAMGEIQATWPTARVVAIIDAALPYKLSDADRSLITGNEAIFVAPANTCGWGDALLLALAAKTNAIIISNDKFEEHTSRHSWLGDHGRVFGAKDFGDLGWVFVERALVVKPVAQ